MTARNSIVKIRSRLNHPVIDSDGHWIEFEPLALDYLTEVGGPDLVHRYRGSASQFFSNRFWGGLSPEERGRRRVMQPPWWIFPTRNSRDRATAMLPRLLYERLDELGLDFAVLYPSSFMLFAPFIRDPELRQAACRAFNIYAAQQFQQFGDRLTPAAVIPMHTPQEALEELEYAVRKLGMKVVMMGSLMRRPIAAAQKPSEANRYAVWPDVLGIDSENSYDPVWAKCLELKVVPTFHTGTQGIGTRTSVSNFVYNHLGHFAAAGEAVCKALFLGGVTRRFPDLKFAFLEGGVGWACSLYADLIGHWKKRNPKGLEDVDPANLDMPLLTDLFRRYGDKALNDKLGELRQAMEVMTEHPTQADDFAACGISRPEDIRDLFLPNFYFGCEADDPICTWAFASWAHPLGATFNILLGSDIGHFDVHDMTEVLGEAYELIDKRLLSEGNLRDFLFANPVKFWAGGNRDFFQGTVVEDAAKLELQQLAGRLPA
ncbi:MAG: amidohydrolase family protein [Candidatus Binataceae bacterium]